MPKLKIFIAILSVLCLLVCMAVPSFAASAGGSEEDGTSGGIAGGDATTETEDTPWYEFIADVFLTVADIIGSLFYIIWDAFTGFFGLFDGINDADGPFNWLS